MPQSSESVRSEPFGRRTPRPWWFRLGGWLLALVLIVALAMVVVSRGTYGATEHTVADTAAAPLAGQPAATLTEQSTHDVNSYLAGPVIAQITDHGVVASEVSSGSELWRYTRSDTTVCAHRVNAQHVTLIYASGDRCDEAISLDPSSGTRQWQRTIEATQANEIVWGDASFISVDSAKAIYFSDSQGFERFTLDNSRTDHIEGEHTSCENLDAAGSPMVATLQRCRADSNEAWIYQVVVNEASDGDPRETGRSYLTGLSDPVIEGVSPDGTTILRDAGGVLYSLPLGAVDPLPISGMPVVDTDEPVHVAALRGLIVVSSQTTAYALSASRADVEWSSEIVAAPYGMDLQLYVPTATGIQERDAVNGQLLRTIGWDASTVAPANIVLSGPLVGLRDVNGLRVYS